MINQQAVMIAYLDDFQVMGVACMLAIPLLLLVKPGGRSTGAHAVVIAADAAH